MFLYKILMFMAAMAISLVVFFINPSLHKPLVIEKESFKLTKAYEEPAKSQTLKLLRLGAAPADTKQIIAQAVKSEEPVTRQINIEPSAFYQYANDKAKQKKQMWQPDPPPPPQKLPPQQVYNNRNDVEDDEDNEIKKPEDKSLKSRMLKRKEETIAWNKWRSDIQNSIMVDAAVSAPIGTLFFFQFTVDKNRHVSNVKVLSSNPMYQKVASKDIGETIKGYEGSDLLKFPPNTKRKKVKFDGSYMIWINTEFSSPDNYSDFERVHYYE